jgi:hypothetical protein
MLRARTHKLLQQMRSHSHEVRACGFHWRIDCTPLRAARFHANCHMICATSVQEAEIMWAESLLSWEQRVAALEAEQQQSARLICMQVRPWSALSRASRTTVRARRGPPSSAMPYTSPTVRCHGTITCETSMHCGHSLTGIAGGSRGRVVPRARCAAAACFRT